MLNLRIKPSTLFVGGGEGEEGGDSVDFNWHCKAGLAANIQTVKDEFCKKRTLKSVKIMISGPPGAGKSFYGKQLAEHYNVPHIHIKHMINDIEHWNKEKEEGIFKRREVKARIRQHDDQLKEEERLIAENALSAALKVGDRPATAEGAIAPLEGSTEKKVHLHVQEDKPETDSDDDYSNIEIKKQLREFHDQHPGEWIPVDMLNEAVRWRLN